MLMPHALSTLTHSTGAGGIDGPWALPLFIVFAVCVMAYRYLRK
ncbi:hypothetical protein [Aeromicrobium sp. Root472D3]|nr:hypothetical protein [Aeromicrobium sp. Root472D3]